MEVDQQAILNEFLRESGEQLDEMEQHLLHLEIHSDDTESVAELFRGAHTLKGNARVVALRSIESAAHTLEDLLDRMQNGRIQVTSGLVSLLLRLVDSFRRLIPRAAEGHVDPHPEHEELAAWLARDASSSGGPAAQLDSSVPGEDGAALVARAAEPQRSLRVEVSKLDRILNLMGEITIARGRLTNLLSLQSSGAGDELRHVHHDSDRLYLELQEHLMRARMVPLGPLFRLYHRAVRDLCIGCGKQARLELAGEDVEVDTSVAEAIRDPLMHMIRNAIDHGIESPEQRRASGKPELARIALSARHVAGRVVVAIEDDGAGLDREAILARARDLGWFGPHEVPGDAELFKVILEPGFSTARALSEVSGRGIGMDVVRRNVEALNGSVGISSERGRGTCLSLRLPLTLAIIDGFRVGVGEETFIIPLDAVVECVELPLEEQRRRQRGGVINLRGNALPYLRLGNALGVESSAASRETLVILRHEELSAGVVVDALYGAEQTVIKPLAALVDRAPSIAGCAILGSGRVALIVDVASLLASACLPDLSASARAGVETSHASVASGGTA